ncbi:hypothetical protein AGMMS49944_24990 [Spirochaetia bacterium]|nr:hypothetical protein AGMMS49944_24990 [Spirochaetia bacterium]
MRAFGAFAVFFFSYAFILCFHVKASHWQLRLDDEDTGDDEDITIMDDDCVLRGHLNTNSGLLEQPCGNT